MDSVQQQIDHARAFERADRFPAALEIYARLAAEAGPHREDAAFWAHLGDLQLRAATAEDAVTSYRRAVDLFIGAAQQNNAIALCRRILHAVPEHAPTLLLLGELSAGQGFLRDARDGYLGHAEVAAAAGDVDAAVRSLSAFLARFPTDVPAREALARLSPEAAAGQPGATLGGAAEDDRAAEAEQLDDRHPDASDLNLLAPDGSASSPALPGAIGGPESGFETTSLRGWDAGPGDVAPLDGLEPTHSVEGLAPTGADEPSSEAEALPLLDPAPLPRPALDPTSAGEDDAADPGESDQDDPLPLLGAAPDEDAPPQRLDASPDPARTAPASGDYVDLAALILDDDEADSRFLVNAGPPTGDEERDMDEILSIFRQKVAENFDQNEATSHYDLGLAFKDMGLLDDAVAQLQKALTAGANPLATMEVLGECFLDKQEPALAARVLSRATELDGASERDLVGVVYLLGRSHEALGRRDEARPCYQRVVSIDAGFRDAATRLDDLSSGGAPPF